jgi:hypothetical protein
MGACLRDEKRAFVAAFSCYENGRYTAAMQRHGDFTKG